MRSRAYWLKPFVKLPPHVVGVMPEAIVAYRKRGCEIEEYDGFDATAGLKLTRIAKYEHTLLLDLWLIKVRIDWYSKGRPPYA